MYDLRVKPRTSPVDSAAPRRNSTGRGSVGIEKGTLFILRLPVRLERKIDRAAPKLGFTSADFIRSALAIAANTDAEVVHEDDPGIEQSRRVAIRVMAPLKKHVDRAAKKRGMKTQ